MRAARLGFTSFRRRPAPTGSWRTGRRGQADPDGPRSGEGHPTQWSECDADRDGAYNPLRGRAVNPFGRKGREHAAHFPDQLQTSSVRSCGQSSPATGRRAEPVGVGAAVVFAHNVGMGKSMFRIAAVLLGITALLLGGCATGPLLTGPLVRLPPAGGGPLASGTEKPAGSQATTRIMLVESRPDGAIIVVNGRPVGRAPLRLELPATTLGFFQGYVEIRARFLGEAEGPYGRTTVVSFSPLERVPSKLRFTPDSSHRTL